MNEFNWQTGVNSQWIQKKQYQVSIELEEENGELYYGVYLLNTTTDQSGLMKRFKQSETPKEKIVAFAEGIMCCALA